MSDDGKLEWPFVEMDLYPRGSGIPSTVKIDGNPIGMVQKICVEMDAASHMPQVTIQLLGRVLIRAKGGVKTFFDHKVIEPLTQPPEEKP